MCIGLILQTIAKQPSMNAKFLNIGRLILISILGIFLNSHEIIACSTFKLESTPKSRNGTF